MSSSESIILWTGLVIGFLVIIAYFVLGGRILLSIIRIFVPNFLRTKEDAPQPAAAPTSWRVDVYKCPFCGTSYGCPGHFNTYSGFVCCSDCRRHFYPDGSTVGCNKADQQVLDLEQQECADAPVRAVHLAQSAMSYLNSSKKTQYFSLDNYNIERSWVTIDVNGYGHSEHDEHFAKAPETHAGQMTLLWAWQRELTQKHGAKVEIDEKMYRLILYSDY